MPKKSGNGFTLNSGSGNLLIKMEILQDQNISDEAWNLLVAENRFASPFQTIEFYKFFNSVPGFEAKAFAVCRKQKILALCVATIQNESGIKSYFSRRAIVYGGPLIKDECDEHALEYLLEGMNAALRKQVIFSETRNLHDYSQFKTIFINHGWNHIPYLNYHLDCSSREEAWNKLNTNRKRQIKKALQKGVIISEAINTEEVNSLYEILFALYKNKVKKPLPSVIFFRQLFIQSLAKFLLVKWNNRIIGGIVAPVFKNRTIYELYICGLDQDYKDASPSVMATWAAIEYGTEHQLANFDFMGAGKPNEEYGVREFKEKFGGQLVEYGRFLNIHKPLLFKVGKIGLQILKRIQ